MRSPLPILSVWSAEYINSHIDEMMGVLSRKTLTVLEDSTTRSAGHYAAYTFREMRNGKIYLSTEEGNSYSFPYKDVGMLEITLSELDMATETQKQAILNCEKEIGKFNTWKEYMQENNMQSFNVNNFNELYLFEVLKNIKENANDLTLEDLKKTVSKLIE